MRMETIRDERFYTIGEAGVSVGVEPHTLRYWEKEFKDFVRPRRSGNRERLYSSRDIDTLRAIRDLLAVELYTIAGARRQMYLREGRQSA
jgi:DNA-binding transcriptional MerR regulator